MCLNSYFIFPEVLDVFTAKASTFCFYSLSKLVIGTTFQLDRPKTTIMLLIMVGAFVFPKMCIIQLSLLPELKWWAWGEKLGAGGWEGQSSCQGWPDCLKLASHSWSKWHLLASFWFAFRRQKGVRSRSWFVVALGVHCTFGCWWLRCLWAVP